MAVVLVGDRKDSESYVKRKTHVTEMALNADAARRVDHTQTSYQACEDVGIESLQINLPAEITQVFFLHFNQPSNHFNQLINQPFNQESHHSIVQ